jgi:hypothetical protein
MTTNNLPTSVPADNTPGTYSGTAVKVYELPLNATGIIDTTVTSAAIAANAATASLSATPGATLPSGSVLYFGGVRITLAAEAPLTASPTAIAIQPAPAPVAANATAAYSNLTEIPLTEDMTPTVTNDEETVKIQGRTTPIRIVNGKDLSATIKTLAGAGNPVVGHLIGLGTRLSPNNRTRLLWAYPDGFALLATVNVSHTPEGMVGKAQRHTFAVGLSGDLLYANRNDPTPVWTAYN